MKKYCIVLAGPTAVGKTSLAIEIARQLSTKIISADSRQCYRELNIGAAKPSPAELQTVQHYFINTHSVKDNLSAADFEAYALQAVNEIFFQSEYAVMTGGTGLYIKAFCEGLDEIPPVDLVIREDIIKNYENNGLAWLQEEIKKLDPAFYSKGEIQNPQRLLRALEVVLSTGRSVMSFQKGQKKQRDFEIIKIGLELPREILYKRVNNRVEQMMAACLEAEVQNLIPYKNKNALQTVGYRELFDYFDNKISLSRAIELIKQNTRHYAKRQMTWFKKDKQIIWCPPEKEEVMKLIKNNIS